MSSASTAGESAPPLALDGTPNPNANGDDQSAPSTSTSSQGTVETPVSPAILGTMQSILSVSQTHAYLKGKVVPDSGGRTMLAVMEDTVRTGRMDPRLLPVMADLTAGITIARGKKRRRDEVGGVPSLGAAAPPPRLPTPPLHLTPLPSRHPTPPPPPPPADPLPVTPSSPAPAPNPFLSHLISASAAVQSALLSSPSSSPSSLASNLPALRHVFLFAATSTSVPSPDTTTNEICGLIHLLCTQLCLPLTPHPALLARTHQTLRNEGTPLPAKRLHAVQASFTEVGGGGGGGEAVVYPCLYPRCDKFFSRLSALRQHESKHQFDRPFRCDVCGAAFIRKYDWQRHSKGHSAAASDSDNDDGDSRGKEPEWKCEVCERTFSRKDALARHRRHNPGGTGSRGCVNRLRPPPKRRLNTNSNLKLPNEAEEEEEENGEVPKGDIRRAQEAIGPLHALLLEHVCQRYFAPAGTGTGVVQIGLDQEQTDILARAIAQASEEARREAELEAQLEMSE